MKFLPYTAILALCLTSCGNSGNPAAVDSTPAQTQSSQPSLEDKQMKAAFIMETTEDSMGIPHTTVSVDYNDSRTALDPMICAGTLYTKEEMDAMGMEVPDNTITGCGGWFAGGGDYYYIAPSATGIDVYKGWQDEGQVGVGYNWEKFKSIE